MAFLSYLNNYEGEVPSAITVKVYQEFYKATCETSAEVPPALVSPALLRVLDKLCSLNLAACSDSLGARLQNTLTLTSSTTLVN
jgi:hypothetical protein